MSYKLQEKESIPTVTYKLDNTIRNNILNYKDIVISICSDEEVSFNKNGELYDREKSKFCDPHHKHIITGDLRIVKTKKRRKLLTKDPNEREL